ncbi:MAG: hypothetical protein Kow0059_18250 [Candidatus Sumerlaeia bacterium]
MNNVAHSPSGTSELIEPGGVLDASSGAAIQTRGLSRRFFIVQRRPSRLAPIGLVNRLFLSFFQEPFWALRDVNLTLERGRMFGIFGDNGSGKSTLLKIIAGILAPTEGDVIVRGRVAPLLELGTGFHPDLTGMENIFLNATILGMTREQTLDRVDRIIGFADIGEHLYSPVRFYSSGMKARLGFAVAVHLDCDIFLIDEILGVGDISFRAKSFQKIRELRAAGKTILLVSHNVEPLKRFCDEVIWMEQGRVIDRGDPQRIADAYLARCLRQSGGRASLAQTAGMGPAAVATRFERGRLIRRWRLTEAVLGQYDQGDAPYPVVKAETLAGTRLVLEADLDLPEPLPGARFGVLAFLNDRSLWAEGQRCTPAGNVEAESTPNAGGTGDPLDLSEVAGSVNLTITLRPAPLLNHTFSFYGVVFNAADPNVVYDLTPQPVIVTAPGKGPTFQAFTWDAPARWELITD